MKNPRQILITALGLLVVVGTLVLPATVPVYAANAIVTENQKAGTDGWQILFFFKQKTAYEIGLGIPAEPLFRSLKANQTGKKFRVGIKSNISTNRNNLISGVDRCIHLNAMKKTTITSINRQTIKI